MSETIAVVLFLSAVAFLLLCLASGSLRGSRHRYSGPSEEGLRREVARHAKGVK